MPLDARERSSWTSNSWHPAFPHLNFHKNARWPTSTCWWPKADVIGLQFPHLWFSTLTSDLICQFCRCIPCFRLPACLCPWPCNFLFVCNITGNGCSCIHETVRKDGQWLWNYAIISSDGSTLQWSRAIVWWHQLLLGYLLLNIITKIVNCIVVCIIVYDAVNAFVQVNVSSHAREVKLDGEHVAMAWAIGTELNDIVDEFISGHNFKYRPWHMPALGLYAPTNHHAKERIQLRSHADWVMDDDI